MRVGGWLLDKALGVMVKQRPVGGEGRSLVNINTRGWGEALRLGPTLCLHSSEKAPILLARSKVGS